MTKSVSTSEVKLAAKGRWVEILSTLGGVSREQLDPRRNVPCPKCGGEDRFNAFKDVAETGGVNCRKCHANNNGDGISTLQWLTGKQFGEVLLLVAEYLGLMTPVTPTLRIVKAYKYRDESGELLFEAVRFEPKQFKQRRPNDHGGYSWKLDGVRLVPYRLPEILSAQREDWLFVVEGEKDCDTLETIGLQATCNPMGAGKWRAEFSELLRGRKVAIIPDNDEPGQKHAEHVASSLLAVGCQVRVVTILTGKDATDYVMAGGTKESLLRLVSESMDAEGGGGDGTPQVQESTPIAKVTLLVDAMREHVENIKGGKADLVSLGIKELDQAIAGGVAYGEMIIVAARPSHGKSAIALQFVHQWTLLQMPCVFVSEEMSRLSLAKRSLQYATEIHQDDWRANLSELEHIIDSYDNARAPAYVVESCRTTDRAIEAIEELIESKGCRCVVVDYAQLLQSDGKGRYEQVTATSIALRSLASRTGVVLCVLCQHSRAVESRNEYVPHNSDLKDSGQLEQDADVIVHLLWHHRLDPSISPTKFTMFIGKNRNREIVKPVFEVKFEPSRQRVLSMSETTHKERWSEFDEHNEGAF